MITRRAAAQLIASAAAAAAIGHTEAARAANQVVKVGVNLSLTGADAHSAKLMLDGAQLAFDQANQSHAVPGYTFEAVSFDDATATAGQYDPVQAATNARKMVGDKQMVAAIGPQMSGAGKAMAPILSQGDLAIITPSSTNPDITDPKFAQQYRPAGKPIYFRTVTTDAFQGPNMANFLANKLHVKTVYILDDSGAYGVGMADAFQRQAEKDGIKVLGRDRLDPKAADYTAVLTKIKSLNPEALYYGGVGQAGVKLAKQAYDIIPNVIKAGGDGVFGPEMLTAAGFPAAEGWYATIASPHLTDNTKAEKFVQAFKAKFGESPEDYSITSYDAASVIIDAVKRLVAEHKPVNHSTVRDAIQNSQVQTIQGVIAFDQNGDIKDRTVSVFQIKKDSSKPLDDVTAQYHYIGVAPSA
ncbi:MAG: branched-chain amino acid ABC transporter substrate-binding protein [Acetobacteraceae bacterium]|nr:branched-chain amino acid ABC transporter substrate-binding protein [Acetobacteraceae bacterium]MBV8867897.1 branched-chain amino acid ABC transporter substrate-binding protein [Acetobacteraceae bacterium]